MKYSELLIAVKAVVPTADTPPDQGWSHTICGCVNDALIKFKNSEQLQRHRQRLYADIDKSMNDMSGGRARFLPQARLAASQNATRNYLQLNDQQKYEWRQNYRHAWLDALIVKVQLEEGAA